jgi:hypothetical protein
MMRTSAVLTVVAGVVVTASACEHRSSLDQRVSSARARQLLGAWSVHFERDRAGEPAPDGTPPPPNVRGRLVLIENRWLNTSYPWIELPTAYGTYDIDFTPFGFEPRQRGAVPSAVAGSFDGDSVGIILEPAEGDQRIAMRGRILGDTIVGTWDILLSRSGGDAGRFVMSRTPEQSSRAQATSVPEPTRPPPHRSPTPPRAHAPARPAGT